MPCQSPRSSQTGRGSQTSPARKWATFCNIVANSRAARALHKVRPMSPRSCTRGMSRLELLMAMGILSVVVGCLFLVTRPSHASGEVSIEHLSAPLSSALAAWKSDHPADCPTIGLLEDAEYLPVNTPRSDPWGGTFRVGCSRGRLTLLSPGPDGASGTKDDLEIEIR